ncbi:MULTISPECIES: hypothetical protein [unclassified Janthinobacterium]|uniref:hypothetical protein n=1 Tax=unclassified Janthinobacterium TaxID=2610881 RepID=UPI0012F7FA33|nr:MULTISPECIES: hypothetical protein [unclassified Janthinobacterium]MEC5161344.1 hypothetical protein [Janthinobacterium sp. CG_S6]
MNDNDSRLQIMADVDYFCNVSFGVGEFFWRTVSGLPGTRANVTPRATAALKSPIVLFLYIPLRLELAQPVSQKILSGERKLFQFSMLGSDIKNSDCNSLRVCV